mmetsp:Transcript_36121/g.99588  ORF Transcript_36121/g.99588 Transcript_36121/m.99588 type:complete len:219 (+) Transcript_36121:857-1513(+)
MAAAASSTEPTWTIPAQLPRPKVSGMTLDHVTVRPRLVNIASKSGFRSDVGSPVTYNSSLGVCSLPLYFTVRFPSRTAPGDAKPCDCSPAGSSAIATTSPLSTPIAAAASSCDATWTIAAQEPHPFVSGMTFERCTVKPQPTKICSKAGTSIEFGSPWRYRLSDGTWSAPAYFTTSFGGACAPVKAWPGPDSHDLFCPCPALQAAIADMVGEGNLGAG